MQVAPFAGAWIETFVDRAQIYSAMSRALRGRVD